ncbi:MAG: MBL fold metallo-hydrolase [Calditrichaeota bacterium]|nr:MBL fold metallo-hydrolase [Calditrichota bacterium]
MEIFKFTLGFFGVNNYLIKSSQSNRAILIDAAEDVTPILRKIRELQLQLVYLINTHGHGDHIAGNSAIIQETGAQLLIHALDAPYLTDPNLNLSMMLGIHLESPPPDAYLNEGDVLEIDDIRLNVLHTPGHTPGHISLVAEGVAFVGDVIFRESIGRTDFPQSSHYQLLETIRTKIYTLPDETVLYNGHGPETTVGHEKKYNPFVRG